MASRDDIVLATKVNGPMGPGPNRGGLSRKHILEACDNSLRRLKIELYRSLSNPSLGFFDPIEETLDALDTPVRAGKVRYLGASSMAAWQSSKALYTAKEHDWHRFVAMQNHYNFDPIGYRVHYSFEGRGSVRRTLTASFPLPC
jgi:1-deoxyxylulose-5-phosphate synthase